MGTRDGTIQMIDSRDLSVRNPFVEVPESWTPISYVEVHPTEEVLVAVSDSGYLLIGRTA